MRDKSKKLFSILGILLLVVITVGTSYAFFSYSRTGTTKSTITSGDISFSFFDKQDISILNAYPLDDSIGANDTANVYEFSVSGDSSSNKIEFIYTLTLLTNNKIDVKKDATIEEIANGTYVKGYFTNDQIKVNLIKNDNEYILGGPNFGVNLSTLAGFPTGIINGSQELPEQTIAAGSKDSYKLRIWIDSNVNYSNTDITIDGTDEYNDAQESNGKYNGYTYSLKVKVDSSANLKD